ncbi:hypothetical protein F8388_012838 [Cannabis sativa]|uniref:Uncharacterized protein n=1 Tax=Cannabis sativa TaxID=3483 RepID=A0A7J6ESK1_CANSA|nr:hypothetical protein F8388_012838 [Cannabis sativa]
MEQTLDLVLGKVLSFVGNELFLLSGVEAELEKIKNELEYMQSLIIDTKGKRGLSDLEKTVVRKFKEKADDIVDFIEEYTYFSNKNRNSNEFYTSIICFPNALIRKHQLATKLHHIRRSIREMRETSNQYYAIDRHHHHHHQQQCNKSDEYDTEWAMKKSIGELALFESDKNLVGIEDSKNELMELLLGESKDLTVISVLGMGGSGKTSLVASLLRSPVVKKHFCGFYAWITISQTNYTIDNVLRSIFKEFADRVEDNVNPQELNTMNQVQLVKMIMKKLQHKRYLVVLDDVWEIENMWLVLKSALLENSLGSRILLTTRKEDVATFSLGTKRNVYNVRPLTENKAWELFWKKALPHDPDQCSTQLLQTARNLIKKCGGLPLGIATLGALMSTKKLEFPDWEGVLRSLNWELSNNQRLNSLKSILLLSFYELPNRLKQCFLYCGNFPEDFEINPRRLARLWIAEGFVELGRGMTHDMMAERYITELVHRGLLQFTRRNHSTQCLTMHDLNREFAVSIAEEEGFFHVYNGQETNQHNKVYRLAVHENYRGAFGSMSKVRSFFVFGSNIVDSSLLLQNLPCDFTLLRVLDLKDFPIPELSKNIVNCYNLTYLCLKRTQVKELPKGIGKLRNLQTLDIRQTEIKVLPKGIVKLTNLRHLFMRQFNYAAKLMEFDHFNICYSTKALAAGLSNLKKLQVLDSVEAGKDTIRELRSLTQLTKIGLTNVHEVDGEDLCILIKEMKCMNFLLLQASNVNEVLKIDELSNLASQFLAKLYLIGKLERLPCWLASLECLKILFLSWSRITDGELILSHVSTLPNLTTLSLIKSYEGNQLWFENGFVKLEILLLCCMPQLNEVIIERGVMPQLEKLFIVRCSHLLIPRGIEHLSRLQMKRLP